MPVKDKTKFLRVNRLRILKSVLKKISKKLIRRKKGVRTKKNARDVKKMIRRKKGIRTKKMQRRKKLSKKNAEMSKK